MAPLDRSLLDRRVFNSKLGACVAEDATWDFPAILRLCGDLHEVYSRTGGKRRPRRRRVVA